jgi:hypothetical protein
LMLCLLFSTIIPSNNSNKRCDRGVKTPKIVLHIFHFKSLSPRATDENRKTGGSNDSARSDAVFGVAASQKYNDYENGLESIYPTLVIGLQATSKL